MTPAKAAVASDARGRQGVDPTRNHVGVFGRIVYEDLDQTSAPFAMPTGVLIKREVNVPQDGIFVRGGKLTSEFCVDKAIEVRLDYDVRHDERLAPVIGDQGSFNQLAQRLVGLRFLPMTAVRINIDARAVIGQLCGSIGNALKAPQLVGRLEGAQIGYPRRWRHLRHVRREHLEPVDGKRSGPYQWSMKSTHASESSSS